MAAQSDFVSLSHSIAKIGLVEPIVIYQDMILDGRNRLTACKNANVKPHFTVFDGDDAAALNYVLAKNLSRRHLTTSQRAIVAAKIADMRQGERTDVQPSANLQKVSQSDAAQKLNVSTRSVASAAKVIGSGDDKLIAAVENGDIPVSVAVEVVELPREERPKALSQRAKEKGLHAGANDQKTVGQNEASKSDVAEISAKVRINLKMTEEQISELYWLISETAKRLRITPIKSRKLTNDEQDRLNRNIKHHTFYMEILSKLNAASIQAGWQDLTLDE